MAYAAMGSTSYRGASKKNMPKHWMPPTAPHTHVAIEDAREQGRLFFNIRAALKEMAAGGPAKERKA